MYLDMAIQFNSYIENLPELQGFFVYFVLVLILILCFAYCLFNEQN